VRFSGVSRVYFFLGWTALWVAAELLLLAVFRLRAPDGLKEYLFEALLGFIAPFVALGVGDSISIGTYRRVWNDLHGQLLTLIFLDRDAITRLRADLRQYWLLWFFAPREQRSIKAQLAVVAQWYQAIALPSGTPWHKRFGEALALRISLLLLPVPAVALVAALVGQLNQWLLVPLAIEGMLLLIAGWQGILMAARYQALQDYFNAWQASRERPDQFEGCDEEGESVA
jgi:hypothetical protein